MKKSLLLVVLMPLIGLSQTVVKWSGVSNWQTTQAATEVANYVTAENITSSGVQFSQNWEGSQAWGWPANYSEQHYLQFGLIPSAGAVVNITNFTFSYKGDMSKMQVWYSKRADFSNPSHLFTDGNLVSNYSDKTVSIDKSITLSGNQRLYIRIYVYGQGSTLIVKNGQNGSIAPEIKGTVTAPTPLAGTYTVGTDADYPTIGAAVNALNTIGVSAPVTFLLKDAEYSNATGENFPITINNVAGTSASKTVTFRPAPETRVTIKCNDGTSAYQSTSVFKLNGADYITFDGSNSEGASTKNLTIYNNNTIDFVQRAVFWVASNNTDGATNITIKNCNIRQGYKNQTGFFCVGIYSGSNAESGAVNSHTLVVAEAGADNANLLVKNNSFMNVKQGIYINGGGTRTSNAIIRQNDLGAENNNETIIQPAYLNNVMGFEYSDNYIYNLYRSNNDGDLRSAGIHVAGNTTNGIIVRNTMRDLIRTTTDAHTFAGITLESTNPAADILIANNFILNVAAKGSSDARLNGHGINVSTGGGYRIYHNTVVLNSNQPDSNSYSAALYVDNAVSGKLDVRNNIFVNNQTANGRRTAIMINKNKSEINTYFSNLNYNDYFSLDKIGFISSGGSISWPDNPDYQPTLAAWKSFTGQDANSVSVLPVFISATDLHITNDNAGIANLGVGITEVNKDIDNQLRSSSAPDMGADEFGAMEVPASLANAGIYCSSSTTWNGSAWSNGQPTAEKDAIFTGNYTKSGGLFNACSVYVTGTAKVEFVNKANAVVVHSVNVAATATLTFESSSNLTQIESTQNSGTVTIKRNSSMLKRLDYTLWSSPVTGTQSLLDFSPATQTTRFYTYNTAANIYNSVSNPATATFSKGKGYLIRMPNNASSTAPAVYEGQFRGTPNNGDIRIALNYTSATQAYNAVGNPYPSPLCITDFIDANIDNIEGTIYIWRKTNDYTQSSYWTVNKAGAVANRAPGGTNDLVASPFAIDSKGVLNTGQGFIVKAKNTKDLIFKNYMRRAVNYNNFFRNGADAAPVMASHIEASHIWVNITNEAGLFNQAMVAYIDGATTGYDNGYDGVSFIDNSINLYTVAGEDKYAIQARPSFEASDVVPMGYEATAAGTFTIALDHVDGVFADGQTVFLKDNATGAIQNLNNGSYTFTTEPGTFNNRFELRYTNEALGTNNPVITPAEVMIYTQGRQVSVKAPQAIKAVAVYDVVGKLIYTKQNISGTEFTSADLNAGQQLLVVKVTFEDNQSLSKNIMLK